MNLPLFGEANYTLSRESEEYRRTFREEKDGAVTAGWELRVPDPGPDGAPFLVIFVGPGEGHRGTAVRLSMEGRGGEVPDDALVLVEAFHESGYERSTIFQGAYGQFRSLADQHAAAAALSAQRRVEAGQDYLIRVGVTAPPGTAEPDPEADGSWFELECVKLWWNETA